MRNILLAAAVALGLAACGTTTPDQVSANVNAGLTVLVDAEACQADLTGIKGLTVDNALKVAITPSCVAALQAAVTAGNALATVVPATN